MGVMTAQEMVDELQLSLGNRQDISTERYVQWLNWSIMDVAGFHRKRAFQPRRFRELEKKKVFTLSVITGSCGSVVSDNTFQITGSEAEDVEGYYTDYIVKLTDYDEAGAGQEAPDGLIGQERLIIDYADDAGNNVATINEAWDVQPDQYTEYTLSTRFSSLTDDIGVQKLYAVEGLEKAGDGTEIEFRGPEDLDTLAYESMGEPNIFSRRGDYLVFDAAPEEERHYRLWYYKYPDYFDASEDLTQQTCELPQLWDEVVVLGAVYRGHKKLMEPDRAMDAYEEYENEITNRQYTHQVEEGFMHQRGLKLKRD